MRIRTEGSVFIATIVAIAGISNAKSSWLRVVVLVILLA